MLVIPRASISFRFFNKFTILLSLNALHSVKSKTTIPRIDYSANSSVAQSNWLITKLSEEGKISQVRKLFDQMPDRDKDVITWTALISGYIKLGLIEEARRLFDRVDSKKNVVTWTAMLSGYMRSNRILEAERLFEEMPVKNVVSWNTMVDGYVQNGMVGKAFELFQEMPERNVVSWNTMLTALAQCGRVEDARGLFDRMPKRDVISWTAMVAGLAKNGKIDEARRVFDRMPERNVVSWNAMITGYSQNMKLDEAFELFERMPERDLSSWNAMITGFIQNGELKRAEKLFDKMPRKNVVSWTTMITGYVQDEQSEEALKIFSKMLAEDGIKPNEGTFVTVLSACSDLAGLFEGQQVHQTIAKTVYQCSEIVVSAIISMYSKCGELNAARRMFDDGLISQRDVVSWNGMIAAYAHHGCGGEAISLFKKMSSFGFKPNGATYVALLSACSHSGMVEDGLRYFDELVGDKSIQVKEDHYACLVDLCSRAGKLKEAFEFIMRLGTKPSVSIWEALLAGCHVHGDVNLGKLAAEKILETEPENAGTHMLLSNIYASRGKWRDAAKVRLKMKNKGLKKQPGCSWIEVGNKVHVFVAGAKSRCHANLIYPLLCELHAKMRKAGSIPNNDYMEDDDFLVI
ncbi:pentatricopeptide repeat-containing protein At2g35030, mitochondrial-like [Herrania umbratica]|uniref:Pentatricopeptide repeat-containing protein At2g35030, mitochondrial-like n=1 Tax=Herrania umbratica TaxID=108875 RepID=A0A6J1A6T2_9ROSI|nr:pentatricopeptide repeat-containing protein At2g35030, mitochondrial-like [Herrania umbratica]XP_021282448.1 pentatricopeptide repeat-containing protein At2g35030, mitochondrial-like [Herrania umbratica]XP_021282449.1 pentatricopeptide repeat-containing protein At2g35030, mitochondrial-like [Herrania umbratica]